MKSSLFVFLICFPFIIKAQIITTFAGDGTIGGAGDGGPATVATIGFPDGCAFDKGNNLYFTTVSNDKVRKVTPMDIISTVAGTGTAGYNGDEIAATNAQINTAGGVAIDQLNNIYIADTYNNRIRKIDAATGIISTVAGNGTAGFGGDNGPATASVLNEPYTICFDNFGNLYIVDATNYRIRKINALGIINTVAGNGAPGYSGDGGMATLANIENMVGICADATGNFYFTQLVDARVRKVTTSGIITTIAGNGLAGTVGDGGPATAAQLDPMYLAFDRIGNLYISGYIDNDIRMIDNSGIIHTVAGTGTAGFMGDNGPATAAELASPNGIALDTCDNLYISDKVNIRIRKVAFNPNCIPLNINNITKNAEVINVYPNPAYDVLYIDNLQTQATYNIVSIIGATVQTGALKEGSNSISVQSLPPAVYMLEVVDEEGERVGRKIIKE